jgi:hypothetical protein
MQSQEAHLHLHKAPVHVQVVLGVVISTKTYTVQAQICPVSTMLMQ